MKVLVTGATGFIGRRVVHFLEERGNCEVIALARSVPAILRGDVQYEMADLLAPDAARQVVEKLKPTHIVHLAWNAKPGVFWKAPDNLDWVAASLQLFRAFADNGGKRIVVGGTCAEYGWNHPILSESDSPAPFTLYGAAKDSLRRLLEAAALETETEVAWGRIFWLYGPEEARGRLVSDVASALVEARSLDCGDGLEARDFMHVDDVAGAFVAALKSKWTGVFNVGSGVATPVNEIIRTLAAKSPNAGLVRIGARPSPANQPPLLCADTKILNDEIGFRPQIALNEGLSATYEWWQQHKL